MGRISIKRTDERTRWLRQAMELTGEKTQAGAFDRVFQHFIADHRNKSLVVDELTPEQIETLSTAHLPISVETQIGRNLE